MAIFTFAIIVKDTSFFPFVVSLSTKRMFSTEDQSIRSRVFSRFPPEYRYLSNFPFLSNAQLVNKKMTIKKGKKTHLTEGKWHGIRVQSNTVMLWNRLHWTLGCGKIKEVKINVFVIGWLRQKRCLSIALIECFAAFFSFTIRSLLETNKHHPSYVPLSSVHWDRNACMSTKRISICKRRNHIYRPNLSRVDAQQALFAWSIIIFVIITQSFARNAPSKASTDFSLAFLPMQPASTDVDLAWIIEAATNE